MSSPDPTEAELLRRYAARGDQAAFAELVERTVGLVYAAALRQLGGSVHRAREVTQLVFIDLARKALTLARRDDLAGWLYTSTHYAAAKLKRGEQRREAREQEAHMMHETTAADAGAADWERLRPVLDDAMLALSEADRAALLQRFFQGRRFAEIGRAQAMSEDAARMRVDRALEKLRALLGQRGITSTGAALAAALANPALASAPAGLAATISGAALAGTSTAAGAAAVFMSKSTLLVSAAAVIAAGVAVMQFNQRQQAEAARAAAETELARVRGELHAATARVRAAESRAAATPASASPLERKGAGAGTTMAATGTLAPTGFTVSSGTIALEPGPGGAVATPGGMTLTDAFNENYAPFFRQLGLTLEQRAQFVAVLVATKEYSNELVGEAIRAGLRLSDALGRQIQAQVAPDRDAKLRASFGDTVFEAFRQWEATAPLRAISQQMASSLFQSETPLSPAQASQVVSIMTANVPIADGKLDILALNRDAVFAQAQGVLAPEQVAMLRRMLDEMQRATKLRRERDAAAAAGK